MARAATLPKLPRHLQWWKPEKPTTIRVRIEVPAPLRRAVGKRELTHSLETLRIPEAVKKSHFWIDKFQADIAAARAVEHSGGHMIVVSRRVTTVRQPGMPLHLLAGGNARLVTGRHGEELLMEDLPIDSAPILPAILVADYNSVVADWALDNRISRPNARKTLAMVKRLFDRHGHTDMGRITGPDIVAHKLALIREGAGPKTVENHLTMLRTIFRWAKANHKMTGDDPTAGIPIKAKGNREGRRQFSPEDRGAILYHAMRSDRPVIKWANLIGLLGGPRLEEIVEADTRDVRLVDGIAVLDIRDDYRDGDCRIKNVSSVRKLPLHPFYADGFMAYAASLPPGPLFPDVPTDMDGKRSDRASNILNPWLRQDVGITDPRKVYHGHRHSAFSLMVNNGVDSVIAKRVTGHTGKDVAEKVYYHGEVPELYAALKAIPVPEPRPLAPPKDIIDAIPDPTADPEPAGYAEAAE